MVEVETLLAGSGGVIETKEMLIKSVWLVYRVIVVCKTIDQVTPDFLSFILTCKNEWTTIVIM